PWRFWRPGGSSPGPRSAGAFGDPSANGNDGVGTNAPARRVEGGRKGDPAPDGLDLPDPGDRDAADASGGNPAGSGRGRRHGVCPRLFPPRLTSFLDLDSCP